MKKILVFLFLGGFAGLPGLAWANDFTGNVNLFLGSKALDSDQWTADKQGEAGLLFDFRQQDWPVNIAVDILGSNGDATFAGYVPFVGYVSGKEEVKTSELNLGVRKIFEITPNMHPYFGGGLAFIHLEGKWTFTGITQYKDNGDGTGLWLNGGIYWTIQALNIGFDLRYSEADVSLDIGDYKGGGGHAGFLVGYHW